MLHNWPIFVCGTAILVTGVVGGIFFAFSDFIMRSLATTPPSSGIDAMTEINRKVYRSVFIHGIWISAVLSVILIFAGVTQISDPESIWLIVGGSCYLLGVMGVSILFNIPMNHKLESLASRFEDSANLRAQKFWSIYLSRWTLWNHVRSVAAVISTLCFIFAFYSMK
ncbi:MAG: DUF1772 domain-containing protein [Phycisphaerales bacterium]|nr:DUF1772 domain-containing protein [Phycisphaerales bacterium]